MTPVPAGSAHPSSASEDASAATPRASSVSSLPDEALDFASRMFDLARSGDSLLLTYLSAGLPPNLTNNRGDTLLMLASYHGHTELVRNMLTQTAPQPAPASERRSWKGIPDVNQLNGRGQSIVAGAVFKGYDEVVKVLLEHGADPLAGQPSAEECAKMFNKWDGQGGYKELMERARGRGVGGREAREAVEDREQARRVPGTGSQTTQQHEVLGPHRGVER